VELVTDKKEALVRVFLYYCGFKSFTISPLVLERSSIILGVDNGDVRDRNYNALRAQLHMSLQNVYRQTTKRINKPITEEVQEFIFSLQFLFK
jgi:hypothetical protein